MENFLLIHINSHTYAIAKSKYTVLESVDDIHRLPLTSRFFAGVALLNNKTVNLADLSACLGHSRMSGKKNRYALLFKQEKDNVGFVFTGAYEEIPVPPAAVKELPGHLAKEVMDKCIIYKSRLIFIINIIKLLGLVHKKDFKPIAPSFIFSSGKGSDKSIKRLLVFETGTELFATDRDIIEQR